MVLALLSKGHTLHSNQSLLAAFTVSVLVTERNKPQRMKIHSVVFGPFHKIIMWSVMVIISFMLDLIAWRDMTFIGPENVRALGLGYITTSIFMIITSKCVITLSIWNTTCIFNGLSTTTLMHFGDFGWRERLNRHFFTHLVQKPIFNYDAKQSTLLNYKSSRLSSLNCIICHISIKCIIEYDYL